MRERNDFSQGRKKRARIAYDPKNSEKRDSISGPDKENKPKRKPDERSKAYFKSKEASVYKPKFAGPDKKDDFRPKPTTPPIEEKGRDAYKKSRSFSKNKDFRKEVGDIKKEKFVPKKDKYFERDKTFAPKVNKTPDKGKRLAPKKVFPVKREKQINDGSIRLNKYIANAGIGSRREADMMIETGLVTVNGTIISTLGYKINPGDEVKCNNQLIKPEKNMYVLLNKPKDYITTTDDPMERKTVMNLVESICKERIYPVGRLDRNTSGVLLFTNDGELTERLTHPGYNIQKVYHAELDRRLTQEDFEKIREGLELEDGEIYADALAYADSNDRAVIGMEIHSGRNRIVRRIFEHLGYDVKALDRVMYAGLTKKNVERGKWRYLSEKEIRLLKYMNNPTSSRPRPTVSSGQASPKEKEKEQVN